LNATCGQSGQPGFGFAGSHILADLESPLPYIRFDLGRDAVLDIFVEPPI
jgi:hypothetical protein